MFKVGLTSSNENRALYQWLRNAFPKKKAVITEGYLQFITLLNSTQTVVFNVLQDGTNAPLEGENRLKRSDSFWATEHGFSIAKTATQAGVRSAVKETFPNDLVFTGATELPALRCLYFTGKLKIQIGSTLYYDNLDMQRFENAEYAQAGLAVSAAAAANIVGRSPISAHKGMLNLTPHVFFNGGFSNDLSISLSSSQNMSGEAGTFNFAIYTARGFYITNGALDENELSSMMAQPSKK